MLHVEHWMKEWCFSGTWYSFTTWATLSRSCQNMCFGSTSVQKQELFECFVLSLIVLVWVLHPLKHLISYDSVDSNWKDLVSSLGCNLDYENHDQTVLSWWCKMPWLWCVRSSERRQGEGNVCSDDWQILFTGGCEMLWSDTAGVCPLQQAFAVLHFSLLGGKLGSRFHGAAWQAAKDAAKFSE